MLDNTFVHLILKDEVEDQREVNIEEEARGYLGIDTGRVKRGKVFRFIDLPTKERLKEFAHDALRDPLMHDVYFDDWEDGHVEGYASSILVAKRSGVTDDEGASAQKAFIDFLDASTDKRAEQNIYTQDIYYFEKALSQEDLETIARKILGNPLIHHFEYNVGDYSPRHQVNVNTDVDEIDLNIADEGLVNLSEQRHLCLDLREMEAIRDYYQDTEVLRERNLVGLSHQATDCEIEILAQTWSEHCKHKEFNALIDYKDVDTGLTRRLESLFKSKICAATQIIADRLKEKGHHWLVKVFSDNAGVVRVDEKRLFVWKVETHNTPSALDPYGGAITGILGNNRDALGTGIGGAKLLFNTNVLCFASPEYNQPLLKGQLPPKRILEGVVKGIQDGGNKSGVPTVNGSIVFDDRYCGKPLVFCGTGATMPVSTCGLNTWDKPISPGDAIIMAGGRVGKDGIHGATLSSSHVDANTPQTLVQIGSPLTQKLLSDFMQEACTKGLIKCSTDNGAGGLSSSVGELAEIPGGAEVFLEKVPLKYSGLQPWEIFVSESQERMTLVVEGDCLKDLWDLAQGYDVELSHVGQFTDSGYLQVRYEEKTVAYLDLAFLHDGVPQKHLEAEWKAPQLSEPSIKIGEKHNETLLRLMSSLNICSKEAVIRRYDHEVQGRSVIKPLMGPKGKAPQDAAVLRLDYESYGGLIISNGVIPRYGDIDAYHMSAGAFDEAVRQIIAVGGSLPNLDASDCVFWSVNDNFCMPNVVYDPQTNPDGKYKLAQLVRMCDALYDMSVAYNIPMTSGKDSMKNDFRDGDIKVSIPPTILYSMVSQIDDVRRVCTSEFKMAGDFIYLVGKTYDELGGSEFYSLHGELGANVPIVRVDDALRVYRKMTRAHEKGILASSHDLSDGGLVVALAESVLGGDCGADVRLGEKGLSAEVLLYSESHSRFIVSVPGESCHEFENLMGEDAKYLGVVNREKKLRIHVDGKEVVSLEAAQLLNAWSGGLSL
ncbi:Phosphoribosylformylglycinamidine synthase subunit PurL [Chlamydiales bacterium SCGC AG-110-M15]|nr:Phosphoribosylformylglycinamidine synthase subunit PurL [Chlamydiales bacterium SCGC AG-110-M15]